jgi:gluconate 5-dehydrogenase
VRGYFILIAAHRQAQHDPRKYGRIVNIARSRLGGNPPEMTTLAYNTSKGAVISFTEAAGLRMGKYNIT